MNAFNAEFFSAIASRHLSVTAREVVSRARNAHASCAIVSKSVCIPLPRGLERSGRIVIPIRRPERSRGACECFEKRLEGREPTPFGVLYCRIEPRFDRHAELVL